MEKKCCFMDSKKYLSLLNFPNSFSKKLWTLAVYVHEECPFQANSVAFAASVSRAAQKKL